MIAVTLVALLLAEMASSAPVANVSAGIKTGCKCKSLTLENRNWIKVYHQTDKNGAEGIAKFQCMWLGVKQGLAGQGAYFAASPQDTCKKAIGGRGYIVSAEILMGGMCTIDDATSRNCLQCQTAQVILEWLGEQKPKATSVLIDNMGSFYDANVKTGPEYLLYQATQSQSQLISGRQCVSFQNSRNFKIEQTETQTAATCKGLYPAVDEDSSKFKCPGDPK